MRQILLLIVFGYAFFCYGDPGAPSDTGGKNIILLLELQDTIQPASASFITSSIQEADRIGAELLIIRLNTPGGLASSMDDITAAMLNCRTPIVVYVAPYGARAASAGMMITISADVAVMAPGTNIGAAAAVALPLPTSPATPQDTEKGQKDDVMAKKIEHDSVAHWRSVAAKRQRNEEMVERAIREAHSFTEEEALEGGLIEFICNDQEELLEKLDNYTVRKFSGEEILLKTRGLTLVTREMTMRQKLLGALSNPNLVIIFFGLGLVGLYFEFSNPGLILPGVLGGIFLILAFFGLQILPINYAGLALIILALIFFIAEVKVTSFGLLTVAGIISMILGSLMLFETPIPEMKVSLSVIIPVTLAVALVSVFLLRLVVKAQRRKATTGSQGLIGEEGKSLSNISPEGKIFVHGEIWDAVSKDVIQKGERVEVINLKGFVMEVKKKA